MSQLTEARAAVAEIARLADEMRVLHANVVGILDRAQNRPPDGDSDGTISADDYTSLRALERQLSYTFSSLAGARRI